MHVGYVHIMIFRVGFWPNGFCLLSRGIFPQILSPDLFSSFLWQQVPREILQEHPRQILQDIYSKNYGHIYAEVPGQVFCRQERVRKKSPDVDLKSILLGLLFTS